MVKPSVFFVITVIVSSVVFFQEVKGWRRLTAKVERRRDNLERRSHYGLFGRRPNPQPAGPTPTFTEYFKGFGTSVVGGIGGVVCGIFCSKPPPPTPPKPKPPPPTPLAPPCPNQPCILGVCICAEIQLDFPACVFLQTHTFGSTVLTLPLYCQWINKNHKCCKKIPPTEPPSRPTSAPPSIGNVLCPLGVCPNIQFAVEWPTCHIAPNIVWNGFTVTLKLFCLQFNPDHKCCTDGPSGITESPGPSATAKPTPQLICLFGVCQSVGIFLVFPACVIVDPPVFGAITLTLPLYCLLVNKFHQCCSKHPPSGPTPPPSVTGPNGGICPLGICAICPQGTCSSIEIHFPTCTFTQLITWNSLQLNLQLYCQIFDQGHRCCQGDGSGGGGGIVSTVETALATCLFGYCISGGITITANCVILDPPVFGSVTLTIPILCQFLQSTHRCCKGVTYPLIDTKCPFGICVIGQVDIRWPTCTLIGSATWNGIPITLPLACLLFIANHKCCKEAPVAPPPPPVGPGGGKGEINGGGQICLFGFCIDDNIVITVGCIIINPPIIGGKLLTIDHICKHINPNFRCCSGTAVTSAPPVATPPPPTVSPDCERVSGANGKLCIFVFCIPIPVGGLVITPACVIVKPPFMGLHGKLTINLFCKHINPNHRCCGGPCETGGGDGGDSGEVVVVPPTTTDPPECDRYVNIFGKLCIYTACAPIPAGGLEITPSCVIIDPPKVGLWKLTMSRICTYLNPKHRCCGNKKCTNGGGGGNTDTTDVCEQVGSNGKICVLTTCIPIPTGGVTITDKCVIVRPPSIGGLTLNIKTICAYVNKKHRCCGGKCTDSGHLTIDIKIICLFGICVPIKPKDVLISKDCILLKFPVIGSIVMNMPIFCQLVMPSHKCCKDLIQITSSIDIDWSVQISIWGYICYAGFCHPTEEIRITEDCVIENPPMFGTIPLTIPIICKYGNRRHRCCKGVDGPTPVSDNNNNNGKLCIFNICSFEAGFFGNITITAACVIVNAPFIGLVQLTMPLFCRWINPLHRCCGENPQTGITTGPICLFEHCIPSTDITGDFSIVISLQCVMVKAPIIGNIQLTLPIYCWFINPSHRCCRDVKFPPWIHIGKLCPFGICPIPPTIGIDITKIFQILLWPTCRFSQLWLWNGKPITLPVYCQVFAPNHRCCREPPPSIGPPGKICLFGKLCLNVTIDIQIPACIIIKPPVFGQLTLTMPLYCWLINPHHPCCKKVKIPPINITCPFSICPKLFTPPVFPTCIVSGTWNSLSITLPLFCLIFNRDHECCLKPVGPLKPPTPPEPSGPPGTCTSKKICINGYCKEVCIVLTIACKIDPIIQIGNVNLDVQKYCNLVNPWHSCCKSVVKPNPPTGSCFVHVCLYGVCQRVCIVIVKCRIDPIVQIGKYILTMENYCRLVNRYHVCCEGLEPPTSPPGITPQPPTAVTPPPPEPPISPPEPPVPPPEPPVPPPEPPVPPPEPPVPPPEPPVPPPEPPMPPPEPPMPPPEPPVPPPEPPVPPPEPPVPPPVPPPQPPITPPTPPTSPPPTPPSPADPCSTFTDHLNCTQQNDCDYDCTANKCRSIGTFTPPTDCTRHCKDICTCRADPKCGYNVDNNQCVPDRHLCKTNRIHGCARENGFYAVGGVLCKYDGKGGNVNTSCQIDETVLAMNLGDGSIALRETSWNGITFWGDKEWPYDDPLVTKKLQTTSERPTGTNDDDYQIVIYQIWGDWNKDHTNGCIAYHVPICRTGRYELAMTTIDNRWNIKGKRGFNIYIDEVRIVAELDIIAHTKHQYHVLYMYLNFEVRGPENARTLLMQGYKEVGIKNDEFLLKFCYGQCYHVDKDYHMGSFSIVRFMDGDIETNDLATRTMRGSEPQCYKFRQNACACRREGCEYTSEKGDCRPQMECTSCMLATSHNCRRENTYYSLGGFLCHNKVNGGNCNIVEVVFAVNFGGPEYTDARGITYKADADVTSYSDTSKTREAKKVPCNKVNSPDKDLYCTFIRGKINSYRSSHCITYEVEIRTLGLYEINFKFAEFERKEGTPGGFNIRMNNDIAIRELDILKYAKKRDGQLDVTILFEASPDGWIWRKGYGGYNIKDKYKLTIGFCYSDCHGNEPGRYTVSALSIVRLAG